MNSIKENQNKPENLKLLAAQRVLYAKAKNVFGLQVIFTALFAALFNFFRLIPNESVKSLIPHIIFITVLISILDTVIFTKLISKLRTSAAKIQELFDCEVYPLPWNKINCGSKPDKNLIHKNFKEYIHNPKKEIKNWYDIPTEGLPAEKAILLCQETNLWYDSNLRDSFKSFALKGIIGMAFIFIIIGLISNLPLALLAFYVIAPLLPSIVLMIKIYMENEKSITAIQELKNQVTVFRQSPKCPTLEQLRQIQDKIYCSRKDSALVPEWFYIKKRNQLEDGMKANASND